MCRRRDSPSLLVGMLTVLVFLENNIDILKNLEIELPFDQQTPLVGIYEPPQNGEET